MEIKLFEIRDVGTCVPAMAVRVSGYDGPIMRRAGFGENYCVLLTMLAKPETQWDAFSWDNARTMRTAHMHIDEHWDELTTGQVLDVRVIHGEATEPAAPDCV